MGVWNPLSVITPSANQICVWIHWCVCFCPQELRASSAECAGVATSAHKVYFLNVDWHSLIWMDTVLESQPHSLRLRVLWLWLGWCVWYLIFVIVFFCIWDTEFGPWDYVCCKKFSFFCCKIFKYGIFDAEILKYGSRAQFFLLLWSELILHVLVAW